VGEEKKEKEGGKVLLRLMGLSACGKRRGGGRSHRREGRRKKKEKGERREEKLQLIRNSS